MLGWELPPYNSGGLGVACYELSKALAASGADIDFVLPHPKQDDEPDHAFMTVHHAPDRVAGSLDRIIPAVLPSAYTGNFDEVRQMQQDYLGFIDEYFSDPTQDQPDVIHAHDWLTFEAGMYAKEVSGLPLVAHVHATEFDRAGASSGNPLIHEIEYHGLLMADRIIAVSGATKQLIIDRYAIPSDKIEVAHNSVDQSGIVSQPLPTRTMYTYLRGMQDEGYTVVTTIGRLTIQKGLMHFLTAARHALSRYDRLLFVIAGDGEQRNELVQYAADLGISRNVFFTGFLRGTAWRELYDVTDIFVMNSVSEPFGLTALEAAVQNTAVLLSKQSGVGEVLTSVLRHDYWDTPRLADEMIAVASSRALRQDLADGAYENFTHVSWERAAGICSRQYELAGGVA